MMLILPSTRNCFRRLWRRHRRSRHSNDDDDATLESLDTVRAKYRLLYEHADSLGGSAGQAFRDKVERTMEEIERCDLVLKSAREERHSTRLTSHQHSCTPAMNITERKQEATSTHSVGALVRVERSAYRVSFRDGHQITVLPSDPSRGYFSDRFFIPRTIDACSLPMSMARDIDPDFVIWTALVVWNQERLVDSFTRERIRTEVFALDNEILNNNTESAELLAKEMLRKIFSLVRSNRRLQQVPPFDEKSFSWHRFPQC
ncbi:hypothetical protein IV203_014869 [Nitzschia inconspicua]|uniref:Uncharacterized protein n=1 Tax=Nitzschia inconspicua TaxID=303405 RepID=A0A9K3L9U1_9STRA|nr:hypothetical protein IV203_014869 [Nitzschia inconspicua]